MRFIVLILLLAVTGCGEKKTTPQAAPRSPQAELEVMVSYLQQHYRFATTNAPLVIMDTFSVQTFQQSFTEFAASLKSQASDRVPPELISDFCDKNAKPQSVRPELGARLRIVLLSRTEWDSFFSAQRSQKPDGWDKFYAKYPHSPGIITISRVGFNRKGDLAMFYAGSQSHWLAGSGRIYVFRKRDGKWVEEPVLIGPTWVS